MRKILNLFAALGLAVLVTGCATQFGERISTVFSVAQKFEITQGQIDAARSTYDGTVLAPLYKYASLPRCRTGQKLTLNNPCHDRRLLKQIREVDKSIARAFADTQDRLTSGDNKGAVAAYDSLMSAIDVAKALINQTGVSVLGV